MNNDDQHRWLDGSLVANGYTNWHSFNPTNGNENYMDIWVSDGKWTDWIETASYKYICEAGFI